MVLTLYHNDMKPNIVFNIIKVTVDNLRTVTVRVKFGIDVKQRIFKYDQDYQRLTIEVD